VKNIVGDKVITPEDIKGVIGEFKKKLMEKNVAQDVSEKIAEAVGRTLIETKTKSFTTVQATVKLALEDALKNILTPKKKIDLVIEINKEKEKLKPYVIVFIGVNGVGKSTNLAKVAYKLKNAKLSVMLAACDNFRAGAIEQIQTHGRNLDIPVFDRGYKEEPSNIAFEAIRDVPPP
jgi:signal recognition particle receptor subunit alpha